MARASNRRYKPVPECYECGSHMVLFGPAKSILFFDIEFHLYCFVCSIFSCFRFVGFQGKVELNQWEEKLMLTFCNNVLVLLFLVAM